MQRALEDAADRDTPEVIRVVQVRHQDLQRRLAVARRRRNRLQNRLEQRLKVRARRRQVTRRRAQFRDGVQHRELQLVLVRVQVDEQIVNLVQHLLRARVRTVDLVDHHNRRQLRLQRL